MKKSLMAFAGLTALVAGPVLAQSSVTIYGVVDATIAHGSGSASSKTQLANSANSSSRLGFYGTEDLGGGMYAGFWIEGAIANDSGAGGTSNSNNQATGIGPAAAGGQGFTFARRSTVSLGGNWGEVRLGRDYTPQYWNLFYDPFGNVGAGASQTLNSILAIPTAIRASNSTSYFLPKNLGGVYGQAMYYLGENGSAAGTPPGTTKNDGSGYGVRVGFTHGPFDIAIATSRTQYAAGDFHQSNFGGKYDFGFARLFAHYAFDKNEAVVGGKARGFLVGTQVPVGSGEIRAAYSRYAADVGAATPTAKKIAVGYVHTLSKRTAVYATYAHISNGGGSGQVLNGATLTSPNDSSKGYDIGLRHSF